MPTAGQSVCRWCLEFSKELMLLSWLKWGQVYFCTLLHFTITSCPITPNHVYHCKRDKSIQFRQKKLPCDPKQRQKWNKTQMLHLLRCLPKLYVNRGQTRETGLLLPTKDRTQPWALSSNRGHHCTEKFWDIKRSILHECFLRLGRADRCLVNVQCQDLVWVHWLVAPSSSHARI